MIVALFTAICRLFDWRVSFPTGAEERLAAAMDLWLPAGVTDGERCPYFVAEVDQPDRCAYCGLLAAGHAPRALRDLNQ